jgi:hypothetical protein|tara:strand:- start:607 stop:843 length:237 start_codon:yes stop_codon:yes gene_type:complete
MKDNELRDAVMNIIKKEIGAIGDVLPVEVINSLAGNLSKDFDGLIERSGYVSRSKYEALKNIADRLEKRIILLEESIK